MFLVGLIINPCHAEYFMYMYYMYKYFPINLSIRVENSVDPDQMASEASWSESSDQAFTNL